MTTTIIQPNSAGKWDRIITARGTTTIRDLVLDGNRDGRNDPEWDGAYNLQSSANIRLEEGTHLVERVTLLNSPGDGILVYPHANATIRDIDADACFRGAVTIVGGNTVVDVDNLQASDGDDPTWVQVEVPESVAGPVDLTVTNSHFLKIELQASGPQTVTNCQIDAGFWCYGRDGAAVRITDCDIGLVAGDNVFRQAIYYPRDVKFVRCNFTGDPLLLFPQILGREFENQSIEFEDCTFVGSGAQAVYNHGDDADRGNTVTFSGTNTYSGFTNGYVLRSGAFGDLVGSLDPA